MNTCVELLNTFTKKEQEDFRLFIKTGFHNTDEKIIVLYNELIKHIVGKEYLDDLLLLRIYNKVLNLNLKSKTLPTKDIKKINKLMSTLTRLAEDFISIKFLQQNNNNKKEILYKTLLSRTQYKLLQKHLNSDKKRLIKEEKKDGAYYYFLKQIEYYHFEISYHTGSIAQQDNIMLVNSNLNLYYILQKLNLWISMLTVEQITHRKFDYEDFEITKNYITNSIYKKNPVIILNLAMINLLQNKTNTCYNALLELLGKYEAVVDNDILTGGYNIAFNFCSYNTKRGNFTYQHLLDLYKILDKKNLLLEKGFMPPIKLKNLIAIACRTEEFDWGKSIIDKYIKHINKAYRNSVYEFNLGVINFYQKKYNAALNNFIRVDDISLTYDINYRIMIMKTHYEVDEIYDERTVQILRSAEKYFTANKLISNNNRLAYKNFVRMLINLYRIKYKETKMKISSFRKKINGQKFNHDKSWLLVKLDEIVQLDSL